MHVVWCPKHRRRLVGGRAAVWLNELADEIATAAGVGYVSDQTVPWYLEHQWDQAA